MLRFSSTYSKILVANRGEIACRIIRTAKKLNLKTVAVYSEADAHSLHVRLADEAYCIGPPPTNKSYLVMNNIINVIKESKAEAVHPGYGFLSENASFVNVLEAEGVTFVGPNSKAMACMGNKIESKRLAKNAGVFTIPGFDGVVENEQHASRIAKEIGFPVMIKASCGGGGKGMRIAWNEKEVKEGFRLSSAEALSSFGDNRLLVERFIDNPRHIEMQLMGDKHGNVVYLPERECSIQRRNQKVIEEAPSMHLDAKTRKLMGEQAVALAKKVGYDSAGTVEFLVDPKKQFYFLEMNTRLQVEHPVTEAVSGLDLVELMIRSSWGEKLAIDQERASKTNGWAFESRVYAEDPTKFLPCIGTLDKYIEPKGSERGPNGAIGTEVRCDSGITEGSEISIYYDPMICKLVTWGENRTKAIQRMNKALDSYVIKGVTHNIPLLRDVFLHPHFVSGAISTKFLPTEYPQGFQGHVLTAQSLTELLSSSAVIYALKELRKQSWIKGGPSLKAKGSTEQSLWITLEGLISGLGSCQSFHVVIKELKNGSFEVLLPRDVWPSVVVLENIHWPILSPVASLSLRSSKDDTPVKPIIVQYLDSLPLGFALQHYGTKFNVSVKTDAQQDLSQFIKERERLDLTKVILSPMPGTIISVNVKEGDEIVQGEEMAVVEAMKMQNVLRAPRSGKVAKVNAKVGASVAADEILIEFADK